MKLQWHVWPLVFSVITLTWAGPPGSAERIGTGNREPAGVPPLRRTNPCAEIEARVLSSDLDNAELIAEMGKCQSTKAYQDFINSHSADTTTILRQVNAVVKKAGANLDPNELNNPCLKIAQQLNDPQVDQRSKEGLARDLARCQEQQLMQQYKGVGE